MYDIIRNQYFFKVFNEIYKIRNKSLLIQLNRICQRDDKNSFLKFMILNRIKNSNDLISIKMYDDIDNNDENLFDFLFKTNNGNKILMYLITSTNYKPLPTHKYLLHALIRKMSEENIEENQPKKNSIF